MLQFVLFWTKVDPKFQMTGYLWSTRMRVRCKMAMSECVYDVIHNIGAKDMLMQKTSSYPSYHLFFSCSYFHVSFDWFMWVSYTLNFSIFYCHAAWIFNIIEICNIFERLEACRLNTFFWGSLQRDVLSFWVNSLFWNWKFEAKGNFILNLVIFMLYYRCVLYHLHTVLICSQCS